MRSEQLTYLDGWRGLAIFLLLTGHFLPIAGLNMGAVGVRLFFALSGFLMARLLITQRVAIGIFLRRRASRIFPAALAFLAIMTVGLQAVGANVSWYETVAAATFTNNYFSTLGHAAMPFGHFWSLCVEEHSYLVLAGLAVAVGRNRALMASAVGLCLVASGLAGAWYVTHYSGRELTGLLLHTEVAGFSLFASVFIYLVIGGRTWKVSATAWAGIVCTALLTQWWSMPAPIQVYGGGLLFALAVNLLPSTTSVIHLVLSWPPLRMLGLWSFSLYLWQQPAYLFNDGSLTQRVAGLSVALVLGVMSFYGVEQPVRRYLNRRWSGQRVEAAQVDSGDVKLA